MNELKNLQNQSLINRNNYHEGLIKKRNKDDMKQEYSGRIMFYAAALSVYKVQLNNGQVVNARSISNSSNISLNSSVSVVTPFGSTAIIDATPR